MRNMENIQTRTADVLVLGAGAAGIRAALSAARQGARTLLLSERPAGQTGSTFYPVSPEWGVMFAEDEADARKFEREIVESAGPCINPAFAHMLAQRSHACFERMRQEGLRFRLHKDMQLVGCFGSVPRGAVLMDMRDAVDCWTRALNDEPNIEMLYGWQAVELIRRGERIAGAMAVSDGGGMLCVSAGAVVLALGGGEALYECAFANGGLLGSAYAMAARKGARTTNLEFIQFINGTLLPLRGLNYYQFALREYPQVRTQSGEPLLERYLPSGITPQQVLALRAQHGPFCVEDDARYFDLSIVRHARETGEPGALIVPDAARLDGPRYVHWRAFLSRMGYAADAQMSIYPFCQGFNGGVLVQPSMQTDLPGLFACGESAGGCHGANRMGGNAMMGTQVFGEMAGESAAMYAAAHPAGTAAPQEAMRDLRVAFPHCADAMEGSEGLKRIRALMQRHCFLERDEQGLSGAIAELRALRFDPLARGASRAAYDDFRAANARDAAILIARAMLARKESRGGHNRIDYPGHREAFARLIYTAWED